MRKDLEVLRLDGTQCVSSRWRPVEIGQKPLSLDQIRGKYIGLKKFSPVLWNICTILFIASVHTGVLRNKLPEKAYMTDLLQLMIDEGNAFSEEKVQDGWVEIARLGT